MQCFSKAAVFYRDLKHEAIAMCCEFFERLQKQSILI